MTVRSDIEIDWEISPRIIRVLAPATELTVQDLIDTCRFHENKPINMDDPYLISAAGKEELGGGVTVGLTSQLNNAQVYFPPRSTPVDDTQTCTTADPDGRVLISTGSTFQSDGLARGDVAYNGTTGAMATILSVDSEIQLTTLPLTGGSRNDWQIGDGVTTYTNPQCNVSGGNLVAVDAMGIP